MARRSILAQRLQHAAAGFSLPELIVVLAIVGLSVAVAIPLVSHELRMARFRGAVDRFTADLRAARMIAVSKRATVDVRVVASPDNSYSFLDGRGKEQRVVMPEGLEVLSSTTPISFRKDGSVDAPATTILQTDARGGSRDLWTIETSVLGIPHTKHERID